MKKSTVESVFEARRARQRQKQSEKSRKMGQSRLRSFVASLGTVPIFRGRQVFHRLQQEVYWRFVTLSILAILVAGCVGTGDVRWVSSGEKPILETDEIMELFMDPIHENLKDAIENPPEKRADWRALYIHAYTLAETNNLLYSRSDHEYMLTLEWRNQVNDARAVTAMLAASIKEQAGYEEIKESYLAVVESCNACHYHYDPEERDAPRIDPPRAWDIVDSGDAGGGIPLQ